MTKIEKLKNNHVAFDITVSKEQWEKAYEKSIKEATEHVAIKGFRKGKAPRDKVIERVGEQALKNEAINNCISPAFVDFVTENKIETVSRPKVEIKSVDPTPVVHFEVAVKPEVDLKPLEKIKVKVTEIKVEDKQVLETIEDLKMRFSELKDVDRAAKNGDRVELDFEGKDKDGVVLDGTKSKNHPVILGKKQLVDDFEKAIIGMKQDEEKTFDVNFPKEYHGAGVAGKTVVFTAKVNSVQEFVAPKDDELGEKMFGEKMPLADLKKRIKSDLEVKTKEESQKKAEDEVVEKLAKATKIEVPEEMVDEELVRVRQERAQMIMQRGGTLEQYLQQTKTTMEDYEKKLKEVSENQVKIRLIFDKIMQENKYELTSEEKKEIETQSATVPAEQKNHFIAYMENSKMIKKILSNYIS